jgi:tetratricopeptide (TPR) repeat protein
VLAAIAAVILLMALFHRSQIAAGREDLRVGIAALRAGKIEEALSALEKAKARFTTGDEERLTRFYLSEAYQRSGRGEEARQARVTSPAADGDAAYLAQSLFLAQGRDAERQQDLQAARKAYESASLLDGPFTAEALLSVARVSEAMGDTTAALAAREKFLGSYPTAPFAEVIREKLGK